MKGQLLARALVFLVLLAILTKQTKCAPFNSNEQFVLPGPQYPLHPFPLIDQVELETAFKKRGYMKFLMKCVFFEGPCDFVGKWLKPRTVAALRNECLVCTQKQQEKMQDWLLLLIHYNEDLFRLAMIKACMDMDIKVPEDERNRVIPFLTKKDRKKYFGIDS